MASLKAVKLKYIFPLFDIIIKYYNDKKNCYIVELEAHMSLYRSPDIYQVLLRMSACRIRLSYYSNPIGFYGGRGHRTQFRKYTTQVPSMPCLL